MSAKTIEENDDKEVIADDVSHIAVQSDGVDQAKLAALKAKMQSKGNDKMANKIVAKKETSLNFGVIGTGAAGSKLAVAFAEQGYSAVAINTAEQDLRLIKLPDSNKLLLEQTIGGAARELSIGEAAAESYRAEIKELILNKLSEAQVFILCTSLGGGSGAGSSAVLVDILSEIGAPVILVACLPGASEDVQSKKNSLETLSKLSKLTQSGKIVNLIVIDNAKLELIYSDVSQLSFFETANKAVVETLDAFNTLSSMPSSTKALDSAEFSKILVGGGGLSVFGSFSLADYQDDVAIAEAIMNNLSGNLLAEGFDLKTAAYCGFMLVANSKVWANIPAASVNYATSIISDLISCPVFKGCYVLDDMQEDEVKVYSFFSGLGLPQSRVTLLKEEVLASEAVTKEKNVGRNLSLDLDTGKNSTLSAADAIKAKIQAKSSAFGKLMGSSVKDRRK